MLGAENEGSRFSLAFGMRFARRFFVTAKAVTYKERDRRLRDFSSAAKAAVLLWCGGTAEAVPYDVRVADKKAQVSSCSPLLDKGR